MLSADAWQALFLTLKLAAVSTPLLLLFAFPLAYWLAGKQTWWKMLLETIFSLPLVLPPTVLGFYLLVLFAPQASLGQLWLLVFQHSLAFSFAGLVLGSMLANLPFAIQPIQAALRGIDPFLVESACALGAKWWQVLWWIRVPVARHGIVSAMMLVFAHTLGEFGVVVLLGGNLAGETRVASIALYDAVQQGDYAEAHAFAAVLMGMSLSLMLVAECYRRWTARRYLGGEQKI